MSKPVKMEPGVKLRDAEKMALIPVGLFILKDVK